MRARPKIHQIIDHQLQLYLNAHRFAPLCCTYQPSYSFFPFASLDVFRWAAITIFSWSSAAIHLCSNNLAAPLHHFLPHFGRHALITVVKYSAEGAPWAGSLILHMVGSIGCLLQRVIQSYFANSTFIWSRQGLKATTSFSAFSTLCGEHSALLRRSCGAIYVPCQITYVRCPMEILKLRHKRFFNIPGKIKDF